MSQSAYKLIHVSRSAYSNGLLCSGGGCPAIYSGIAGSFVVVGRKLSAAEKVGLAIDPAEDALEVPGDLLRDAAPKLNG